MQQTLANSLAEDIWTVEGPEVVFAGAPMHTRMTVVRLSGGGLWIHSPIPLSSAVQEFVREIGGQVDVIVAPNKFHYLFVGEWTAAYPEAQVYAEPKLMAKQPKLGTAHMIGDEPPTAYADVIDQLIFGGNAIFQEAVFFHKPSRTLILTDLFINLSVDKVKAPPRWFLQFEGVVFPNGGLPRLWRWLCHDRAGARACLHRVLAWQPQRITFSHGKPLVGRAEDVLRREFAWLL